MNNNGESKVIDFLVALAEGRIIDNEPLPHNPMDDAFTEPDPAWPTTMEAIPGEW